MSALDTQSGHSVLRLLPSKLTLKPHSPVQTIVRTASERGNAATCLMVRRGVFPGVLICRLTLRNLPVT